MATVNYHTSSIVLVLSINSIKKNWKILSICRKMTTHFIIFSFNFIKINLIKIWSVKYFKIQDFQQITKFKDILIHYQRFISHFATFYLSIKSISKKSHFNFNMKIIVPGFNFNSLLLQFKTFSCLNIAFCSVPNWLESLFKI